MLVVPAWLAVLLVVVVLLLLLLLLLFLLSCYRSIAFLTSMLNMSQASTVLMTMTMPGPKASRARLGRARMKDTSGRCLSVALWSWMARSCLKDSLAATCGCSTAALQVADVGKARGTLVVGGTRSRALQGRLRRRRQRRQCTVAGREGAAVVCRARLPVVGQLALDALVWEEVAPSSELQGVGTPLGDAYEERPQNLPGRGLIHFKLQRCWAAAGAGRPGVRRCHEQAAQPFSWLQARAVNESNLLFRLWEALRSPPAA